LFRFIIPKKGHVLLMESRYGVNCFVWSFLKSMGLFRFIIPKKGHVLLMESRYGVNYFIWSFLKSMGLFRYIIPKKGHSNKKTQVLTKGPFFGIEVWSKLFHLEFFKIYGVVQIYYSKKGTS